MLSKCPSRAQRPRRGLRLRIRVALFFTLAGLIVTVVLSFARTPPPLLPARPAQRRRPSTGARQRPHRARIASAAASTPRRRSSRASAPRATGSPCSPTTASTTRTPASATPRPTCPRTCSNARRRATPACSASPPGRPLRRRRRHHPRPRRDVLRGLPTRQRAETPCGIIAITFIIGIIATTLFAAGLGYWMSGR